MPASLLELAKSLPYNWYIFALAVAPEVPPLKLIRTIFQDHDELDSAAHSTPKLVLVVDMAEDVDFRTDQITGLAAKMESALPGVFPDENSILAHNCGGKESGVPLHTFREEIEQGTDIPHLLEHVILFLLSKRCYQCSGYCGQRSVDIEAGILTHFYIVLDYSSKLEAVVAVDLAMQLVSAWMQGKTVIIEPEVLLAGVREKLEPMVMKAPEAEVLAS